MNFPPPTQRQARILWTGASALAIISILLLIAGIIWGLGRVLGVMSPVIWPIAIAGIVAYLLDPVVDFFEQRKVSRARSIVCVFLLAFFIVGGVLSAVVPQLVLETNQLASKIPDYATKARARVQEMIAHPPKYLEMFLPHEPPPAAVAQPAATPSSSPSSTNPPAQPAAITSPASHPAGLDADTVQKATTWVASALPGFGKWLFGQATRVASWFGILAGLALIPVYAFYFLLEKEPISARWTDYLPVRDSRFKTELVFILTSINNYLIAFFRGQVLVAICDGILYALGFLLIGLPYAVLLGFAAIFLTIIPFLGAFLICGTAPDESVALKFDALRFTVTDCGAVSASVTVITILAGDPVVTPKVTVGKLAPPPL